MASIIGDLAVAHIGDDMLRVLRCRVFDRLIRLPMVDHEHRARGDQLSLLTTDAQAVSGFLSSTLPGLMPGGVTCLGALALMASVQPVLAMVVVVTVPPCVIVLRLWMGVVRRRARALHDAHGANVSVAEQAIELLPVIKAEAREGRQSSADAASAKAVLQQARRLH